jgi:uncharacterized membrane protein YjjB (DUF3815 family)
VFAFFLVPLSASCFALATANTEQSLFIVMVLLGVSYGFSSTLLAHFGRKFTARKTSVRFAPSPFQPRFWQLLQGLVLPER